jgi:hypothetical protein
MVRAGLVLSKGCDVLLTHHSGYDWMRWCHLISISIWVVSEPESSSVIGFSLAYHSQAGCCCEVQTLLHPLSLSLSPVNQEEPSVGRAQWILNNLYLQNNEYETALYSYIIVAYGLRINLVPSQKK